MPDEWIRQWGDPVLRDSASPLERLDDVALAQVQRMKQRLLDADGAGLAATQVGFMRRLFVYRLERDAEVEVLINPKVSARGQDTAVFLEGCLSYPAITVAVERPVAVRVRAQSLDGHARTLEAEGVTASLLQHEIDHLDGILTLDRAEPTERRRAITALLDAQAESWEAAQR